jgi:ribose transport system substrate-binding protein
MKENSRCVNKSHTPALDPDAELTDSGQGMSRRRLLEIMGIGTAGLAGSGLLAALGPASPSAAATETPSTSKNHSEVYAMVAYVTANPWWGNLRLGGEAAAKFLGVGFSFTGPSTYDVAGQVSAIEQTASTRPAGMIVPTSIASAITPAIDSVTANGIPVVTVDADSPASKRLSFIGTDAIELGELMGAMLVKGTGGKANIGIETVPGQINLEQRFTGVKNAFKGHPGMKIIATANNNGDTSTTATTAAAMLEAHPDMDALLCLNATSDGIITALKETNRVGKVKAVVSGVDGPTVAGIEDGTLLGSMAQRTYMEAYLAVMCLYMVKHATPYEQLWTKHGISMLPPTVDTGTVAITKENASAYTELIKRYNYA